MTGQPKLRCRKQNRFRRRQLASESLEYRLVLTCATATQNYDFGDLPDTSYGTSRNNYQTAGNNNGPSHALAGPRLGTYRDPETFAQPDANANGDDPCYPTGSPYDDEDGITFPTTMIIDPNGSTTGSLLLDLQNADSTSNKLDAWIDFNKDGDFADTGEQIFDTYSLGTTSQEMLLNFTIPAGTDPSPSSHFFGRFRLSTQGGLSPQFFFWNGEVEDHVIPIEAPANADLTVDMALLDSDELTLSTSGNDLVIESDGETLLQAPLASAKSLTIEGPYLESDTVKIDVTGKVPVPSGGLTIDLLDEYFNEGNYADQVHIVGTLPSSLAPEYAFSSSDDGTVKYYDGTTLKHTITLTNIETVADVSSGTGLEGTLKHDTEAQDLRLRAGPSVNGKTTTKIDSDNNDMPDLLIGEKSLEIVTGAAVDVIAVKDTAGIETLTLSTGGSNDIVSILDIDASTDVDVFTENGNDLVFVGVEYGTAGVNSGGKLNPIDGTLDVDMGANTVGYVDVINIRDMDSNIAQTYSTSGSLVTRSSGNVNIGLTNVERIDLRTGDYVDTVTVADTDGLTSYYLETGGSNDIVSVLGIDSVTSADIQTRTANDLIFVGVDYPTDLNSSGDLSPIEGELTIDGGTSTPGYLDVINIRDMDTTADQAYTVSGSSFTRAAGSVEMDLVNLERIDLRTGDDNDQVVVEDTNGLTSFYLETGGSNDIVSILAIASTTDADIQTRNQNDLIFLGVQYPTDVNTSGDLTPIAGQLSIDGGNNDTGYADVINIRDLDATADHDYDFTSTGFTRGSSVDVELSNMERIDLRTGSGDDTIDNAMAYAAGFYAAGGDGNDTLTGGSGADSLIGGAGNDTLDGAGDDDVLFLGTGADTVNGGTGDDYIHVGGYDAAVDAIFGDDGTDEVVGSIDGLDSLTSIETDNRT